MRRLEHGVPGEVVDIAARGDADAADLRRQRIREIVAVEIERRNDVELLGTGQHLLQRDVGDGVLDDDASGLAGSVHFRVGVLLTVGRLGALPLLPGVGAGGKLTLGELIAPVAECAFGELLDIALVNQRQALAPVGDGVADRGTDETLRPFLRHRLDADAGAFRKADLGIRLGEGLAEQLEKLPVVGAAGLEFDAGIDVLGVLTEDYHVDFFGMPDGRGHAPVPAHRAQAHKQVEHLTQRHVERADAATDRGGERSLDGHEILAAGGHRLLRQPGVEQLVGLLSRVDLHPVDAPLAAVGLGHRGVHDAHAGAPDVGARAVTLDEWNDRVRRDQHFAVADGDLRALGGRRDLGAGGRGHEVFSWGSRRLRGATPGRGMLAHARRSTRRVPAGVPV